MVGLNGYYIGVKVLECCIVSCVSCWIVICVSESIIILSNVGVCIG